MAHNIPIPVSRINYSGLFNEKKLLTEIRGWLIDEGYDFKEPTFKHKVGPGGTDIELVVDGEKKISGYVKFFINLKMWVRDMNTVTVMKEGAQMSMQEGRVQIETSGHVQLDWQNRFGGSRFLQSLHDFYMKYLIKQKIEVQWWDKLYYKIFKFNSVIRNVLGFETA